MQLTTEKLKSLILEVLNEAAAGIDDIKYKTSIGIGPEVQKHAHITVKDRGGVIDIYYSDKDGRELSRNTGLYGRVRIMKISEWKWADEHPCNNAMVIRWSQAKKGFGPLLYDVAIEVATKIAGGLTSDRKSVSDDAYKIWDYYLNKRSDVIDNQMDNEKSNLTPKIKTDDCLQKAAVLHSRLKGGTWESSPISKIYSKESVTLQKLKSLGRLILDVDISF